MASLRDVRLKIRSVKNIAQITQAMKLVAAAKLRRVQERVEQGKPYSQTMAELVGMLAPNVREFAHPLLEERPVTAIGVVVISADKGLAGSYNSNLLRVAHQFVDRKIQELSTLDSGGREKVQIITIGKKATEYFSKRGYIVVQKYMSIGDKAGYLHLYSYAHEGPPNQCLRKADCLRNGRWPVRFYGSHIGYSSIIALRCTAH